MITKQTRMTEPFRRPSDSKIKRSNTIEHVPVGDILSTVGDTQYRGGYDAHGGYYEYRGGIQYHGGYHLLEFE